MISFSTLSIDWFIQRNFYSIKRTFFPLHDVLVHNLSKQQLLLITNANLRVPNEENQKCSHRRPFSITNWMIKWSREVDTTIYHLHEVSRMPAASTTFWFEQHSWPFLLLPLCGTALTMFINLVISSLSKRAIWMVSMMGLVYFQYVTKFLVKWSA